MGSMLRVHSKKTEKKKEEPVTEPEESVSPSVAPSGDGSDVSEKQEWCDEQEELYKKLRNVVTHVALKVFLV